MGIKDWFSPKKAEKANEKQGKRGFDAAKISRLTASWTTQPKPIDADIQAGLKRLRARSREQALNNDYVARFLSLTRSNVIGPNGIILQAKAQSIRGNLDTKANDAIEASWNRWGRQGSPDVTGQHSFISLLGVIVETLAIDGEFLAIKHFNFPYNDFGFALELVDVEVLDVENNQTLRNGNTIKMGVEFNQWRRPVAYHLITTKSTDSDYQYNGKKYRRIPAERVIHRFLPRAVWQTRGFPWLAPSLMRLNMLAGYEEAELVAARVASAKMGILYRESGSVEYTGEEDERGDFITDAEPGSFEIAPDGYKLQAWDPAHPATAYRDFIKGVLRGIAAGLGISYHSLANDLEGVNYSSGRLGALEDREVWKALQNWLIESFCEPVYADWLTSALLNQKIKAGAANLDPETRQKYLNVTWQPRRWAWVDPQKDMQANIAAIEQGLRSRSDVIREQGRDPDDVWQEIKREQERLKELGINIMQPTQTGAQNETEE